MTTHCQILLNGDTQTVPQNTSVSDLLNRLSLANKRVAVEINGDIVPRSQHATHQIADGDNIEVVVAVGGG